MQITRAFSAHGMTALICAPASLCLHCTSIVPLHHCAPASLCLHCTSIVPASLCPCIIVPPLYLHCACIIVPLHRCAPCIIVPLHHCASIVPPLCPCIIVPLQIAARSPQDSSFSDAQPAGNLNFSNFGPEPPIQTVLRPPPSSQIDSSNWLEHARAGFPHVYDPDYHTTLYEMLFDAWPQLGKVCLCVRMCVCACMFVRVVLFICVQQLSEAVPLCVHTCLIGACSLLDRTILTTTVCIP